MITYNAWKICIITEKVIQDAVLKALESAGARGYTFYEGGGKGEHHRHDNQRASMLPSFGIVKIEAIVRERSTAEAITDTITQQYFKEYSGIIYLQGAEIMRPEKF